MSVLDVFFGRGGGAFRSARCKTLLKLTIPRIKLLRNKREMQLKQMRRDIANLLGSGQEATARIRVEHIIREENMKAAQEILELFCELIAVRLPIIEIQKECPLDLKEAISSVCFAAPRCADLPELQQVQMMFVAKYGRDFVNAATELLPDSGVNRQVIELLSVRAPPNEVKVKLLKEIAEEHGVEWDPLDSETQYEDLLNGPNNLVHLTAKLKKTPTVQENPKSDSDSELDLDLPDVPTASVPPSLSKDHEHEDLPSPNSPNQFLPFVAPPPNPETLTFTPPPPPPEIFTEAPLNPQIMTSAPPPPPSPLPPEVFSEAPLYSKMLTSAPPPLPSSPPAKVSTETGKHSATFSSQKSDMDKDLHDAVAAANAAALTAERAAAAARLAASLAQVKIAELEERTIHDSEQTISEREVDKGEEPLESIQTVAGKDSLAPSLADGRQTVRTVSMEDDPYLSYPNLFSRQNSSAKEHTTGTDSSAAAPASLAQVKLEGRTDLVSEKTISDRETNKGEEQLESIQAVTGEDSLGPPLADGRQTLRTVSMEDDQYFSYPNLFSRQNSSAMEHATGTDSSAR